MLSQYNHKNPFFPKISLVKMILTVIIAIAEKELHALAPRASASTRIPLVYLSPSQDMKVSNRQASSAHNPIVLLPQQTSFLLQHTLLLPQYTLFLPHYTSNDI
jgi:hypothetical protein